MQPDKVVRSTCPFCGVGCQVLLNVKDDYIIRIEAPFEAAPNYRRLCQLLLKVERNKFI